jgi:hypothetical protein
MAAQAALSLVQLETHIVQKIGQPALDSMIAYVGIQDPELKLWGLEKPTNFQKHSLCLWLYHDLSGLGFQVIEKQIIAGGSMLYSHNSMMHNASVLRHCLDGWSASKIELGNAESWNDAAVNGNFPPSVRDANLWIDSVDVKILGRVSRKSPDWSYKLNHGGRRYVTIADAHRVMKQVLGGHSPKIHDGAFLETCRDEFKQKFRGARFIGDNHFQKGKTLFDYRDNIKFYTNFAKKRKRVGGEPDDAAALEELAQEHVRFNLQHQGVRSRVESPFAWMKETFKSLRMWRESAPQLDMLFRIVVAIHNMRVRL